MSRVTIHKKDIVLNRNTLKDIIDDKGIDFTALHEMATKKYGLDISYKGFMSLIGNRTSWKLLYAYAIADILDIQISDIFEIVDVDVNEKIRRKKEWREKYQKNDG